MVSGKFVGNPRDSLVRASSNILVWQNRNKTSHETLAGAIAAMVHQASWLSG